MGVLSSGNGFVEWGWILGYSSCDGKYYSNPRTFTWWKPNNGASDCRVLGSAAQSTWYDLSIADGNSDTVWLAKREGNTVDTINVNFDRGDLYVMGERDCTCDSAYADFKMLDFQVAGSNAWHDWLDPDLLFDNDPAYHWHQVTVRHVKVVHD